MWPTWQRNASPFPHRRCPPALMPTARRRLPRERGDDGHRDRRGGDGQRDRGGVEATLTAPSEASCGWFPYLAHTSAVVALERARGRVASRRGARPASFSSRAGRACSARRRGACVTVRCSEQQAPRKGRGEPACVARRHRSCARLWLSVPAVGTPTVTVEDRAQPRPSRSSVIGSRSVAALCTGVRQLTVAWGGPVGAPVRTRQLDRAVVFEMGRNGPKRSHVISHILRGPLPLLDACCSRNTAPANVDAATPATFLASAAWSLGVVGRPSVTTPGDTCVTSSRPRTRATTRPRGSCSSLLRACESIPAARLDAARDTNDSRH